MKINIKKSKVSLILLTSATLIITGLLTYGYNYLSTYERGVLPPFAKHDVAFIEYEINADETSSIHTPNGTHLEFQPNSFVTANGRKVKGKVKVKVREFHSAMDIFKSGIPMNVDEGRSNFLQSAGMLEVSAMAGNKKLKLKYGKSIKTQLAGFRPSEGYDLYQLKDNQSWANVGEIDETINIIKEDELAALPPLPKTPNNPEPDSTDIIFELISDYNKYPYLIPFDSQKWEMLKEEGDTTYPWGFRVNWDHVEIKPINKKKMEFELTFSKNYQTYNSTTKKDAFTIRASPVLKGENLRKAKKEFMANLDKYNEVSEFLAQEQDRLAKEADLVNTFSMNQLGIWNCDKFIDQNRLAEIDVSFDFEDQLNPYINEVKLYAIMEDENSVVVYNPIDWDKLKVVPGSKTKLVAILPNGNVAFVPVSSFLAKVKKYTGKVYFETKQMNADDFFAKELSAINKDVI